MEKVKELRSISPDDYCGQWTSATRERAEKILSKRIEIINDKIENLRTIEIPNVINEYTRLAYNIFNHSYVVLIKKLKGGCFIETYFEEFESYLDSHMEYLEMFRSVSVQLYSAISNMKNEGAFNDDNILNSTFSPFYCITTDKQSQTSLYSDIDWNKLVLRTEMRCIVHGYRDWDERKYYMLDYNGKTYTYDMDTTYITYMENADIMKYLAQNDINLDLLEKKISNTRKYISELDTNYMYIQSYRLERTKNEYRKLMGEQNNKIPIHINSILKQKKLFYIE